MCAIMVDRMMGIQSGALEILPARVAKTHLVKCLFLGVPVCIWRNCLLLRDARIYFKKVRCCIAILLRLYSLVLHSCGCCSTDRVIKWPGRDRERERGQATGTCINAFSFLSPARGMKCSRPVFGITD